MKIQKKLLLITFIIVFIFSTATIAYAAFRYEVSDEKTMDMPEDLKNALLEHYNSINQEQLSDVKEEESE